MIWKHLGQNMVWLFIKVSIHLVNFHLWVLDWVHQSSWIHPLRVIDYFNWEGHLMVTINLNWPIIIAFLWFVEFNLWLNLIWDNIRVEPNKKIHFYHQDSLELITLFLLDFILIWLNIPSLDVLQATGSVFRSYKLSKGGKSRMLKIHLLHHTTHRIITFLKIQKSQR